MSQVPAPHPPFQVASFYKFVPLPHYQDWQQPLFQHCQTLTIKGTILLASEGINGTIAGTPTALQAVMSYLHTWGELHDLQARFAPAPHIPFQRLKVKLKREIVTLGQPQVNPLKQVGHYVPPEQWNELLADPEVTVIDTRNGFEVAVGTFRGAINPQTRSFREFPAYVQGNLNPQTHRKVALFCTGGIRCEKATSLMLDLGFEQVYHLQGGILNYLDTVPPEQSLWDGECFVFDDRVTVQDGLEPGHYHLCDQCGYPLPDPTIAPDQTPGKALPCPRCHP